MVVYFRCNWLGEIELFSEITLDGESQLNVRTLDGRSTIVHEDETNFYRC